MGIFIYKLYTKICVWVSRERNGRSPTRKCELVMCRASTQVYALVRIIECQSTMHIIMQLVYLILIFEHLVYLPNSIGPTNHFI